MAILEFLKDVSVIVASCVAVYGINSWRREYRGKKRADLAEEALCLFYEGRNAIAHIRNPLAEGTGGKTRKASENETPEQKEAYDNAYVLIERYNAHVELFNKLHSMRNRFMALFGNESAKPFIDFRKILNELIISARSLARSWAQRQRTFRTEEQERRLYNLIEKQEAIFWEGLADEDPIAPRVDACIQEIEAICRPILTDQGTIIKTFLVSFLDKAKKGIANKGLHKDRS